MSLWRTCISLAFLLTFSVYGQTKADSVQIKNLVISPITAVERFTCVEPAPPTNGADCTGLKMIRLVLADGTVLGPYVAVQISKELSSDPRWIRIPLTTPDPPPPTFKIVEKKDKP